MACPSVSMNSVKRAAAFGCGAVFTTPAPFERATAGSSANQSIGAPSFFACTGM
jgi:hypothetical protein